MQQYRINYPLLIGLIVGTFVCSGAIYAIHHFQNSRQSGWLLSEAEKAHDEKNYRAAAQYYQQYLSIHPGDSDARLKFANSYVDVAQSDDVAPEELGAAVQVLEATLRNSKADDPDAKVLRRRLVDLYARDNVRNWNGALDHLNLLLTGDPTNAELQVLHARYLARSGNLSESIKESYKLIGYDPKTDTFDIKKATAPHSPEVYSNLAALLRKDKPELAERVANQMVNANAADADAYVERGRLRAAWHDSDGSHADAQKAYQLKPEDSDVLLFVTDVAADSKDYDKARAYLAAAKKLHPKEGRIYQRSSSLELQQGKFDQATKEIDEGVKAVDGSAAIYLMFLKARLQIDRNDIKGARQTIDDMKQEHKLQPEILDYFDSMIMVAEGKWFQASEALSKLRPRIAPSGARLLSKSITIWPCVTSDWAASTWRSRNTSWSSTRVPKTRLHLPDSNG